MPGLNWLPGRALVRHQLGVCSTDDARPAASINVTAIQGPCASSERRVRATVPSRPDRHSQGALADKFRRLDFVTPVLLSNGSRNLIRNAVS